MNSLAVAICGAILLSAAFGVYLRLRQIAYVGDHRGETPPDFRDKVTAQEHRRAADYTVENAKISIAETLYSALVSLAWLLFWLAPLYWAIAAVTAPGLWRSLAITLSFAAIASLLDLPFSLARTFWLDARFGLNKQRLGGFLLDWIKSSALEFALGAPLLLGMFALLAAFPHNWWLFAYAGFMLFALAMTMVYPNFIAPLFNTFTPMPQDALRERLEALLSRCGFSAQNLYVMDASTRSTRGNAYFAGFGKTRRIVLFDTLIAKHSPDEIESILAHELGHFKFGHIKQSMALMAAVAFAGFAILYWALGPTGLASAFGFPFEPAIGFAIMLLAREPVMHVLTPIFSWRSRRAEFEADNFAKEMVGEGPMISALTRLTRDNLATLTPDRLYAMFYYSHPPAPERIAHLRDAA
ncbi:M48 family metallopeptidase [Methylocystis bryophila]|uniref:Peptidase M48 n=1 Tax=Methylocystis bryophila TaxID=655015 RepID=A0A1W6MYW0_9HYPH|nr:M48 family metallopeptidase [Methylocystis bryophila]ARN82774.1 peptidase M48 [Methylocystis bryophila]BDV39017.1 integral membrane zinc-metalloprotease [Methylocystis bryophila]